MPEGIKMRLIYLHEHQSAPGQGGGGAESFLQDQMQALNRLGYQTLWWYNQMPLEQAIAEFKPDVAYVGTIHTQLGLWPVEWLRKNKIPHVWAIMDYYPFCSFSDGLNCTGRMMLVDGDKSCPGVTGLCPSTRPNMVEFVNQSPVMALNEHTADIYRRHGMRVDYVVELGIDTDKFCPGKRSDHVSIYTSSAWLMPHKGIHLLREALDGTGLGFEQISGVTREHVCQAIKAAHIFVFTSVYEETFGLSLCENMSTGCACVAFDVAGARAQIHSGTGILVENRNVNALRNAILRLVNDKMLREEMGENARQHVLYDHSLEAMGKRLESVYQNVISR